MANGLSGFASGLMSGAKLGMDIKEQQARRARESEESLLRQEASKRAAAQETRAQESHEASLAQMQRQEKRAASGETRAQESHEASLAQMKEQRARAARQEARLDEAQDLSKQRIDLDIKRQNWDQQRKIRQEKETQLQSMAPVEFKRVLEGGQFSDEFMDMSEGTKFDPRFMNLPEYKEAAKVAYETVDDLVAKFTKDPNSVSVADYNGRDFIDAVNMILGPDVRQGVGTVDPATGKVISDKRIAHILPAPDEQGMVFEVETTFEDGTKYIAPVTENRTSDPDDQPRVVSIESFMDNINGSMQMASAFSQPDLQNYMTANFPVGGKDTNASSREVTKRQWLREQGDVDKWETDRINDIDPNMVEDYDAAVLKIQEQAQERRNRIDDRYGYVEPVKVGGKGSEVAAPSGGGEVRMDINTWAKGDSGKARFIQEAQEQADLRGVDNPFAAYSPSELDAIYREWSNDSEAADVAASLR